MILASSWRLCCDWDLRGVWFDELWLDDIVDCDSSLSAAEPDALNVSQWMTNASQHTVAH